MSVFYDRLTGLCQDRGIAVTNLGNVANIPVTGATISRWQLGVTPRNSTVKAIADYCKVDVAWLLGKDCDIASGEKRPPTDEDCASCPCRDKCKLHLTPQEHKIIELFREASEIGKMQMISEIFAVWQQDQRD